MSSPKDHSLQDLAALSGVNPRTIRDYVQKGLLRGADSRGPKARYSATDLERLILIRRLREGPGLGLDTIRTILTNATASEIHELATSDGDIDGGVLARLSGGGASRALEYLDQVRDRFGGATRQALSAHSAEELTVRASDAGSLPLADTADTADAARSLNALQRTTNALGSITPTENATRRIRPALWVTLPVTPDLELRARVSGALDTRIQEYQRLAEQIRELLLGGAEPPERGTR